MSRVSGQRAMELQLQQRQTCDLRDPRCHSEHGKVHDFLIDSAWVRPPLSAPEEAPDDMIPDQQRYLDRVVHQRMPCPTDELVWTLPTAEPGRPVGNSVFTNMERSFGSRLEPDVPVGCHAGTSTVVGPNNMAGKFRYALSDEDGYTEPLFVMRESFV